MGAAHSHLPLPLPPCGLLALVVELSKEPTSPSHSVLHLSKTLSTP